MHYLHIFINCSANSIFLGENYFVDGYCRLYFMLLVFLIHLVILDYELISWNVMASLEKQFHDGLSLCHGTGSVRGQHTS